LVTFVFAAGLWATAAQAQTKVHPLTGNARFQLGDGRLAPIAPAISVERPIPIGLTPAPNGRVIAVSGATVVQTTGPDPRKMVFAPGQLTAPGNPVVVGVYLQNSVVLQVKTAIPVSLPRAQATLSARGRTGASTVSFCPGQTVTPSGNPGCVSTSAGPGIRGRMRYTKTAAQFGGLMQGNFRGSANIALRVSGTPPGTVTAVFALATPFPTGAQGGPFGFKISTSGAPPPPPNGLGGFVANAAGTLIGPPLWQHATASGIPNPVKSYGGPWTTGMVTISAELNDVGPYPEIFVFSGMDSRVNGVGNISLVSGSVSWRALSGPNANRGWLNLTVGPRIVPTPAVSKGGLAAVFGLFALAGGYALRWRVGS
jgi:hypothetical protein